VPVMLSVVHLVKASRGWYEAGAGSSVAINKEARL
jgi:ACR3 family arsenite transporter